MRRAVGRSSHRPFRRAVSGWAVATPDHEWWGGAPRGATKPRRDPAPRVGCSRERPLRQTRRARGPRAPLPDETRPAEGSRRGRPKVNMDDRLEANRARPGRRDPAGSRSAGDRATNRAASDFGEVGSTRSGNRAAEAAWSTAMRITYVARAGTADVARASIPLHLAPTVRSRSDSGRRSLGGDAPELVWPPGLRACCGLTAPARSFATPQQYRP